MPKHFMAFYTVLNSLCLNPIIDTIETVKKGRLVTSVNRNGFTIIELLVVIAVIAILATIITVSYGSWRTSIMQTAVRSDITAAAAALDSARSTNNGYPLALPASFTQSDSSTVTLTSVSTSTYCLDGVANSNPATVYYLDSRAASEGPKTGTCSTRPNLAPPAIPASVTIAASTGTSATVNWPYVVDATSYTLACAADAAYIYGPKEITVTTSAPGTISGIVSDLTPSSSYFCRVKATNSKGTSQWSGSGTVATNASYSSLAAGTSIEGYWTEAPQGFLLEDGSAVSRSVYSALFAVIGTTYGTGNGSTTFNLPDSRGTTTVSRNASDVEFAAVGQRTGSGGEILSIAQMPSHTHLQNAHDHNGGSPYPYVTAGGSGVNVYSQNGADYGYRYNTSAPAPSATATNQNTGSGSEHVNIQPSIVKVSAIKFTSPDSAAVSLPAGSSINGYWSAAPSGYLIENGAAVSRATYSVLFASIGTTYGAGDGSTTFNLPDSRGRAGVNISTADTEFDAMAEESGAKRETLSVAQIPSHTHTQNAHTHLGGYGSPYVTDGAFGGASTPTLNGSAYGFVLRPGPSTVAVNQNTGGGLDHNNIQQSITKSTAIKFTDVSGSSGQSVAPGTSVSGWWSTPPAGYLAEDGSAVSRVTYANLFSVIGTAHGAGNGSTTFNLPDSRGRIGVNKSLTDTEFDTIGEKYGVKSVTIATSQLPSHTHIQNAHDHNSGIVYMSDGSFGGTLTMSQSGGSYGFRLSSQPSVAPTNQSTGGGGSHNNIQPSIVKRFVIKT